jgi:hypothetical protein
LTVPDRRLSLEDILEREIELYQFENSLSTLNMELSKKYEEAQRNYEEAQRNYDLILTSRIWRYSRLYRSLSASIKTALKKNMFGRLVLRALRRIFR